MENKIKVLETFFKEVWTKENTPQIKQLFIPDETDQKTAAGLGKEEKLSPTDFEVFQQALLKLVKNIVVTIDHYIEDEDWISIRCTVTAVSRKNGRAVHMTGSAWARITDGKIREAYNFFDFLHFFEGLELLPENTMLHCLQGNSTTESSKGYKNVNILVCSLNEGYACEMIGPLNVANEESGYQLFKNIDKCSLDQTAVLAKLSALGANLVFINPFHDIGKSLDLLEVLRKQDRKIWIALWGESSELKAKYLSKVFGKNNKKVLNLWRVEKTAKSEDIIGQLKQYKRTIIGNKSKGFFSWVKKIWRKSGLHKTGIIATVGGLLAIILNSGRIVNMTQDWFPDSVNYEIVYYYNEGQVTDAIEFELQLKSDTVGVNGTLTKIIPDSIINKYRYRYGSCKESIYPTPSSPLITISSCNFDGKSIAADYTYFDIGEIYTYSIGATFEKRHIKKSGQIEKGTTAKLDHDSNVKYFELYISGKRIESGIITSKSLSHGRYKARIVGNTLEVTIPK